MSRLTDLAAEMKAHLAAAKAIADKAEADGDRDFTPDEKALVHDRMSKAKALQPRIEQAKNDERTRAALRDLGRATDGGGPSWIAPGGKAGRSEWATEVADQMTKTAGKYNVKALTTGSIDVPSPIATEVVAYPQQPRRISDLLIDREPLTAQTYTYLRQTARTNNAAPVADGAVKPTSIFTVAEIEDRARVYAHLAEPFPERYLADYPSLVAWLESEMEAGVLAAVERQIIAGDGVGENATGILATSGTIAVPFATNELVTLRKARTSLEMLAETPNAWLFNPLDLETIDLLREDGAGGGFLVGGASPAGENVFGGLPRVASVNVPAGTAILGDFRQARLFVREDVKLDADRSGENFRTNQVVLRVEGRFGIGVLRPQAFAVVDLTAL